MLHIESSTKSGVSIVIERVVLFIIEQWFCNLGSRFSVSWPGIDPCDGNFVWWYVEILLLLLILYLINPFQSPWYQSTDTFSFCFTFFPSNTICFDLVWYQYLPIPIFCCLVGDLFINLPFMWSAVVKTSKSQSCLSTMSFCLPCHNLSYKHQLHFLDMIVMWLEIVLCAQGREQNMCAWNLLYVVQWNLS